MYREIHCVAASFMKLGIFYVRWTVGAWTLIFIQGLALDEPGFESLQEQDIFLIRNLPTDSKDHLFSNSVGTGKFSLGGGGWGR